MDKINQNGQSPEAVTTPEGGETVQKSKRQRLADRLREKHQDVDFDDDEAFAETIGGELDEYENQLKGYKDNEEKLAKMYTADPRSAAFMDAWAAGKDPELEFLKRYGDDLYDYLEDPSKQEQLAAAHKEWLDRVTAEADYETQYNDNLVKSLEVLEGLQTKNNLTDEAMDDAIDKCLKIGKDLVMGIISPELIEMVTKADKFDAAVAEAKHQGQVAGRNAHLDERLKLRKASDGMPTASADGGDVPVRRVGERQPVSNFRRGRDIWKNGNETRIKRT